MEIIKNFVVFEGLDGSGTTTQLNLLENSLNHSSNHSSLKAPPVYKTYEPTDGIIGRIIRSALRKEAEMTAETIALLFAADRQEHLYGPEGILERCKRGELVLSDRYFPSSLVYQGISCGRELPARLNQDFPGPELILFLDINPEIAQERISGRVQKEIFEYLDFQIKARELYKEILAKLGSQGVRVEIIDAAPAPEEVAGKVWDAVKKMPIFLT